MDSHSKLGSLALAAAFLFLTLFTISILRQHREGFQQEISSLYASNESLKSQLSQAQEALQDIIDENSEIKKEYAELLRKLDGLNQDLEGLRSAPDYSWNVPLEPELQEHIFQESVCRNLDPHIVLAVSWHESRLNPDVPDYINTNGTIDRGPMQINSCNWEWAKDMGLDVNDPMDNYTVGIIMLAELTEKHGEFYGLAAYASGESGMRSGGGTWFADWVISNK